MTELLEMVSLALVNDDNWKCPFEHEPVTHDKKNVLPPPKEVNNASTLSDNLHDKSQNKETLSFTLAVDDVGVSFQVGAQAITKYDARYTAHHLIPGNEAWAKGTNQLRKWVDKKKNHVLGDVGYDVNDYRNGIDLPGNKAVGGWSGRSQNFQTAYAFASMQKHGTRQFHDRHPAYSDFVLNVLNKVAEKLKAREPNLGCGKKHCGGDHGKKYDPPYKLHARLNAIAARLASKLVGTQANWQKPLMTSRFALMYQDRNLSQQQAREALDASNF